ncbi:MAG: helix-turn-helix domain-containing protein [Haloferacaceae archaeon]
MATDDSPDGADADDESTTVRERLERGADRALAEFDEGVVDLLAWLLDTETRALIYIYLRSHPDSTSDEVAEGTGLYPSTVREALAELHEEHLVTRRKRESAGAGNNPYEYRSIPPGELVRGLAAEVQDGLNAVFRLDDRLGDGDGTDSDAEPVRITVEGADD